MNTDNKKNSTPTTIAAWSLAIVRTLKSEGIAFQSLLQEVGLDIDFIEKNPESRIPIQTMTRLWQLAAQATGNSAFGLKVASKVQPMHFRALGMLMLSSNNMLEVLDNLAKYHVMISDSVSIRLEHLPDRVGFIIQPLIGVELSELAIDAFFATLLNFCKQLSGNDKPLVAAELQRSHPVDSQPWWLALGVEPTFASPRNCLWLQRSSLMRNDVQGDMQLRAVNEARVKAYLNAMNTQQWREPVRLLLEANLSHADVNIAAVATQFHISERSLKRYLHQEGTSFRELYNEVRMRRAEFYLTQTEQSLSTIADALGFSDSAAFGKACARWFGMSPGAYRQHSNATVNS